VGLRKLVDRKSVSAGGSIAGDGGGEERLVGGGGGLGLEIVLSGKRVRRGAKAEQEPVEALYGCQLRGFLHLRGDNEVYPALFRQDHRIHDGLKIDARGYSRKEYPVTHSVRPCLSSAFVQEDADNVANLRVNVQQLLGRNLANHFAVLVNHLNRGPSAGLIMNEIQAEAASDLVEVLVYSVKSALHLSSVHLCSVRLSERLRLNGRKLRCRWRAASDSTGGTDTGRSSSSRVKAWVACLLNSNAH
jgi:hypothetical protein